MSDEEYDGEDLDDSQMDAELNNEQLREARRLTQMADDVDPAVAFKERAELRERYHEINSKLSGAQKELDENGVDVFDEKGCEELELAIKQADADYNKMGANGKELACDSDFLLTMSNLLLSKMQKLNTKRGVRILKGREFARKILDVSEELVSRGPLKLASIDADTSYVLEDSDDEYFLPESVKAKKRRFNDEGDQSSGMNDYKWAALGRKFGRLLKLPGTLTFIRPLLSEQPPVAIAPKAKKERRPKEDRTKAKLTKLEEKDKNHDNPEQSVTRELDNIRKCLRRELRRREAVMIPYYEFVLDPTDFARSIENMFYTSFLVKDGHIRIELEHRTGVPRIVLLTDAEKAKVSADRSTLPTNQAVVDFAYDLWKELVDLLEIKEPIIKRVTTG